jgi:pimeloyl-ACP methyl ester carboxylesterase
VYVDLGGNQTWYEELGSGPPLVLLHGAMTDARSFFANTPALAETFRVLTPERRGHGHTADLDGPITYDLMAADTIAFLDQVVDGPAHLVGHSDGANVALLVSLARPDLVDRMVLMSGNFRWDGLVPGSIDMEELIPFVVDGYDQVSPDGRDHLPVVAAKLARMIAEEPTLTSADLARVDARTLVMAGDDDVVRLDHTISLYEGIPNSELVIVPGTSHLLNIEKPELCNQLITTFLAGEPTATFMPIRRATPTP